MRFFLKKALFLGIWIILSCTLSADAGNTAIFGSLMPSGPSFMAGEYVSFGFWSNDIEFYIMIFWSTGLITFFLNRKLLVIYFSTLIFIQIIFIEIVNDGLLTLTGYMLLIPIEVAYLITSFLLLKKHTADKP